MTQELFIRKIFQLGNGITVLACEASAISGSLINREGTLVANGKVRQKILLSGERNMLNQTAHSNQRAIETRDIVELSSDEAQTGLCKILLD